MAGELIRNQSEKLPVEGLAPVFGVDPTPPRAAPNFTPLERKNGELPLTVTRRFTCVCGGEGGI